MNHSDARSKGLLAAVLVCAVGAPDALFAARPRAAPAAGFEQKLEAWNRHQELVAASPFHGLKWRAIGPVVQGGRVVDLEVAPDEPYTFYAAYASGGLWRTTNNGHTFEPLSDEQPSIIMGDVALDPNRPERIWVGTGENNSSRSSYGGMGVYRSDDRGATWRYVGLGDADRIGRIVVDLRNPERVFVAALGKLYTPGGERGVYLTEDGGTTWRQVLPGGEWTGFVDLVMKPGDPDTLYAAAWERRRRPWDFVEGGAGSGIFKSTDGGATWTRLAGGLPEGAHVGRIGLAVSPAAPDVLYASIDNQEPLPEADWDLGDRPLNAKRLKSMSKAEFLRQDPEEIELFIRASDLHQDIDAATLKGMIERDELTIADLIRELEDANTNLFTADIRGIQVWRSDDSGAAWRLTHAQSLDQVVYSYGYYFGQIRVSPKDPDRVYVLGVPIITSGDGGETWDSIQDPDVHVDYQSMWIHPEHPQHVIVGNDGGIDMSFDGGKSWLKVDAQPVGQFYTVNVDLADPYNVYGGLQDNGTIKCSSRNRWWTGENCQRINGGDGMYVAIDPRDNKTVYTGYQFGYYTRIGADGARRDVRPRDRLGDPALRYNWNTPVILSPHNPDVVYFGANLLYRSLDQGQSWTAISPDLTRSQSRGDVPFATLTTVSESPLAFGLLWAGTDDGEVWLTEDGGDDWFNVAKNLPRDRWVSRVEASHHERERAYLSFNGYRDDDIRAYVYLTDDLGRHWTDISGGLPAEPVNVIREDPVHENLLYVGTDRGVYASLDRGATWHALAAGLPKVPVHDLVVHPRERELVAGTHGRSIWIVDVLPLQELASAGTGESLKVFYVDEVQASRDWRSRRSRWFYRAEDDPEVTVHYWAGGAGAARLELLDADDRVLRVMEQYAAAGLNAFTWDLLVDQELALAAEQAALAGDEPADPEPVAEGDAGAEPAATDDSTANPSAGELARTPYAESVRLGHPLYAMPGEYRLRVSLGENQAAVDFTLTAPEKLTPRGKEKPKLRGRK